MTGGDSLIAAAFEGALGAFSLNVAFEAPARGITALFGPSGSGKTTLLRCVAGLTRLPGRLTVAGEVWQDDAAGIFRKPHQRAIGYVFQEASLFPHLSVRKNLLYGAKRARGGAGPAAVGFDDVVAILGLGPLLERGPRDLSGGERQRTAVGRALLSRPRLLLMDEPLASLDSMSKEEILPYLETLHQTLSTPILYVSHDIGEVARLADRMVVLANGRKVGEGSVESTLERLDLQPATGRFEAGVVLTARVAGHDARYQLTQLDHGGQTIALPLVDIPIGSAVRVRIRARDVALAVERPSGISIRNVLHGTVAEIAAEESSAFAEILADVGGAGVRARITRASVDDLALHPGKPVFVLVKSIAFDRRALATARAREAGEGTEARAE